MIKYEVIDNYLSDSDFTELKDNIFPTPVGSIKKGNLSWDYIDRREGDETGGREERGLGKVTDIEPLTLIHDWYLCHTFLAGPYQSSTLPYVGAILDKIVPLAVYRIMANLTVQQEKKRRNLFHIDYTNDLTNNISMFTSIFYMNTTNGPTILEDGTEIECRANRFVTFPYNTYHAWTLCTDQPYRIIINFNYFADRKI